MVETSLILLEGRAAGSDKQLDSLLETLQEVGKESRVVAWCSFYFYVA